MERREFLRHAAVGAAGLMLTEAEKEVVDDRLTQKVTCTFKGTALSDLCEHLRRETGVQVTAGPSVADEKVTLFCEKLLLREVMRQLSRPFGYTWLRSRQAFRRSGVQAFGKDGIDLNARTPERLNAEYRYELVQDLRSQLLEEELRNRDRNTALLALQQEMERYRPYLDLSPDEALARSRQAGPEEKRLLRQLAGDGWGPVQMFFRLAPQAMEALRAGQKLIFSQEPKPGEQPLPAELARGVLQSLRDWQLIKQDNGFNVTKDPTDPRGLALTTVPEARARVSLELHQSELGQFVFEGVPGFFTPGVASGVTSWGGTAPAGPQAVGRSPAALIPDNAVANAKLAGDPALRRSITVQPQPDLTANPFTAREGESPGLASGPGDDDHRLPSPSRGGAGGGVGPEPKVTSADVLEALHQATGLPIVSDYFTRLHPLDAVSARNQPLFAALNQLADAMHRRWSKEGEWLQFRSTSFYTDRLKEVPNRLLDRWAAARRRQGFLTLEDLVEIAQLPDAPLDGAEMAEGARDCLGLAEWDLARDKRTRPHLRYLSSFTPAQRQEAMSAAGLPFSRMSLPQQQQFIAFALQYDDSPLQSLDELAGATLRVDYTQPGWFEWRPPGPAWLRWVVPGEPEKRVLRPFVRERTRAAALEALRRLDPHPREAAAQAAVQSDPRANEVASNEEAQIVPTRLELVIIYIPGSSNDRLIHAVAADFEYTIGP